MKHLASCLLVAAAVPAQTAGQLLDSLSLEQKAGQLFMSWSLSRSSGTGEADNHDRLLRWVRDAELGGVILSLGTVEDAATLIPRLQAASKVPLLLAGDFEGGVWFRLSGATELCNNMLLGAARSEWLCEEAGRITGEEARALGFHWVFAPVLDVNSNPDNPIINVRSFGEDPRLVARLGAAFTRGINRAGLIACGKHFPGHGDVATDSHLEMPTVPGDGKRLREVELLPFKVASEAGLGSVMTGHLAVPGLGEDPSVPATLSKLILGDVLRGELGFEGLIVTDALEMGGVKNAFPPGEVAVRALLAGADVLLMPPDPVAARAAVVDAVNSGRVPMARLDDAVMRILRAKERVGLLDGRGQVDPLWRERVNTDTARTLASRIARRGITLARDRGGNLPLPVASAGGLVQVSILDRELDPGPLTLVGPSGRHQVLSPKSTPAEVEAAVAAARDADCVVLGLHVKVGAAHAPTLPANARKVLDGLTEDQKVIAVSFGSPYLVRNLPVVDTYLCAYASTVSTQRTAASILSGIGAVSGRLPVSIPGVAELGSGLTRYRFVSDKPKRPDYDVVPGLAERLRGRLEQAIVDKAFPGAVCMVARHGEVVAEVPVGRWTYHADSPPVRRDTIYDLASLTKVCATTPAVLRLVAERRLSLDDRVDKWVPSFVGDGKERVTVRHLLAHCSGLPAYVRFFRTMSGRDAIVEAAAREGLMVEPGSRTIYSDLGFILLMAIVEAASGQPFEEFAPGTMFWRAHHRARFVPTAGWPAGAPPTEDDRWRGTVVEGYVHDENAFAMGGISGHAGLFACAADVLALGNDLLGGGGGNLPRSVVAAATRPAGLVPGDDTRGLGYQMLRRGTWAGSEVSAGAFGHTGFTGTSLLCDPELDYCVVLLTNRVHPTRVNNRITEVRRAVHDIVRAAMR